MPARPRLSVMEIVLGVGAGAVAAGVAALILFDGPDAPQIVSGASSQTYAVAPFTEIATVGPQDVVVTIGDTQSVRAQGSPGAIARLEAVVADGRLTIKPRAGFDWNWGQLDSATFYVTVPQVKAIALAGSGDIRVDRIDGERFDGTVGGPGAIRIGSMKVDEADFTVAGSGDLFAAGTARDARVTVAGSGEIHARELRSETASVSIGGSGDVQLGADQQAQISITGSGDVDIAGPARCSVTRMGTGDVRCNGEAQ